MKITDVKAVSDRSGAGGRRPDSDGGRSDQQRAFGYVEVFTDEGSPASARAPPRPRSSRGPEAGAGRPEPAGDRAASGRMLFQGWRHPKMDELMTIAEGRHRPLGPGRQGARPAGLAAARRRPAAGRGLRRRRHVRAGKDCRRAGRPRWIASSRLGFRAVKMKVGWAGTSLQARRRARARPCARRSGRTIDLMVDANHAWTAATRRSASRAHGRAHRARTGSRSRSTPGTYAAAPRSARALDIPVATGENVTTRYGFRDMIDARGRSTSSRPTRSTAAG